MPGTRRYIKKDALFSPGDAVRSKSGRRGVVTGSHGEAISVRWSDGEEFPLMPCHLTLDERPFGAETARGAPGEGNS